MPQHQTQPGITQHSMCSPQHLPQHTHPRADLDRKSTRLNSSHGSISYAVFCLKKKTENKKPERRCQIPHTVQYPVRCDRHVLPKSTTEVDQLDQELRQLTAICTCVCGRPDV